MSKKRSASHTADGAVAGMSRKEFERELATLQLELVKMLDWIRGERPPARRAVRGPRRRRQGRHDQARRRPAQPAVLPRRRAPRAHRARADAVVLPALRRPPARGRRDRAVRPLLVQPRRRRAGDGLLHRRRVLGVPAIGARSSSACWSRSGIQLVKYWFSVSDEEQERRFQARIDNPAKRWKLSPLDLESREPLGRLLPGQGPDDRAHVDTPSRRGTRSTPTTSAAPGSTASPTCCRCPYEDVSPRIELPPRQKDPGYRRPPKDALNWIPTPY